MKSCNSILPCFVISIDIFSSFLHFFADFFMCAPLFYLSPSRSFCLLLLMYTRSVPKWRPALFYRRCCAYSSDWIHLLASRHFRPHLLCLVHRSPSMRYPLIHRRLKSIFCQILSTQIPMTITAAAVPPPPSPLALVPTTTTTAMASRKTRTPIGRSVATAQMAQNIASGTRNNNKNNNRSSNNKRRALVNCPNGNVRTDPV